MGSQFAPQEGQAEVLAQAGDFRRREEHGQKAQDSQQAPLAPEAGEERLGSGCHDPRSQCWKRPAIQAPMSASSTSDTVWGMG